MEYKGEENAKTKKKSMNFLIPAVEVEPLGCSFNPPFEAHKDALAEAVADEMQKIYREELGLQPVPPIVPGRRCDEHDKLRLHLGSAAWPAKFQNSLISRYLRPASQLRGAALRGFSFRGYAEARSKRSLNLIKLANLIKISLKKGTRDLNLRNKLTG